MAFVEDKSIYFHDDDFGVAGLYTRVGRPRTDAHSTSYQGIYQEEYVEFEKIKGYKPTFLTDAGNFERLRHDDQLVVENKLHLIKEWQPDGTGMVQLILEVQS